MAIPYEVIKAKTPQEAVDGSKWSIGCLARCVAINAIANSDGTWTVTPEFDLADAPMFRGQPVAEDVRG